MEETLKAYLAGCMDSEGTLGIKRSTVHLRRGLSRNPDFHVRVSYTQTSPIVVDILKENFRGSINISKRKDREKLFYRWQATDIKALICVNELLPYLKLKTEQAKVLFALNELKRKPKKAVLVPVSNRWGGTTMMPRYVTDPEVLKAEEELFNKIKQLNNIRPTQPQLIGQGLQGAKSGLKYIFRKMKRGGVIKNL